MGRQREKEERNRRRKTRESGKQKWRRNDGKQKLNSANVRSARGKERNKQKREDNDGGRTGKDEGGKELPLHRSADARPLCSA
ncbi:hypothetical protein WR25_07613 [Diploscapter pachys]|uniref:Uncharacterized protein n=1 Tax=Diploscapter pachys TaxID=2018661 RepID=A0A2A2J6U9_9BILA|nr:hypothetical protein WR25_07613 [Diploscapter pachys]